MKKFFGLVGMAVLGGTLTLGGYKLLFSDTVIVERTTPNNPTIVQANYNPAFNANKTAIAAASVDFTIAAEKTVNSVVHVKNTTIRKQSSPFDIFFGNGNGTRQFEQVGTGSGVIISSDGYIVTNNHVIDKANEIQITLNNQKKYKAELIGADENNDIALLKIEADIDLPYTPFANSDNIKIGEWVLAVGNPYNLTSTVTAGIVSAKGRDLQGNSATDSFIQTDAAVNPGNSGGALVNTRGELVGINTAISSKTGSYVGYSFAVPSNIAKKIIDDLLEFGKVQEAIIGFVPDLREDDVQGVRIGDFSEGSNAEKSGLKKGDIIVKINDVKISKFSELSGQLTAKRPGESVDITIDREGSLLTKNVKLIQRIERFISRAFQIEFKDLDKKELKKNDISGGAKIIREGLSGEDDSSFVGFIITKINNREIKTASEASTLLDNLTQRGYRIKVEMINTKGEVEKYNFR